MLEIGNATYGVTLTNKSSFEQANRRFIFKEV